jgi:hypothetical protein
MDAGLLGRKWEFATEEPALEHYALTVCAWYRGWG